MRSKKIKSYLKNKNFQRVILISALIILIILIFIFALKKILPDLGENYRPDEIITSDESLDMQVIFNDLSGDKPFSDLLISKIRSSTKSIDVAVYSIDSEEIRDELYEASNRGVRVNLLINARSPYQVDQFFFNVPENFELRVINYENTEGHEGYMHHKFAIFDRETQSQELLMGAWNWTLFQEMYDSSFIIDTKDKDIINSFIKEFDRLWQGYHGDLKLKLKDYRPFSTLINYDDSFLEIWFSPGKDKNSIKQRIIDMINDAEFSIKIMAWQITDQDISDALVEKAKSDIQVTIITDDFNIWNKDSIFNENFDEMIDSGILVIDDSYRNSSIQNLPDEDFNSFLHHHTLIIDDKLVLFGTNNWGSNAHFYNDESMIITNDKEVVDSFLDEFNKTYDELNDKSIEVN